MDVELYITCVHRELAKQVIMEEEMDVVDSLEGTCSVKHIAKYERKIYNIIL